MKFKKGNGIKCTQDHMLFWYKDIPENIDWVVTKNRYGNYQLSSYGYGQLKPRDDNSYGNGALFPYCLNKKQKQELECALIPH